MIVIAIIGILAIIAIPRFVDLVDKAREGATKGNIGAIRGALVIYYGDHEGNYPLNINATWGGSPPYIGTITLRPFSAYMEGGQLPRAMLRRRAANWGIVSIDDNYATIASSGTAVTNRGGWLYYSDTGQVFVNANVTDTKGYEYSSY
jgi:type II secretory pathway pseudopilin PulG